MKNPSSNYPISVCPTTDRLLNGGSLSPQACLRSLCLVKRDHGKQMTLTDLKCDWQANRILFALRESEYNGFERANHKHFEIGISYIV
jgi:hypothetical protein